MTERSGARHGLYVAGTAAAVWIAVTLLLLPSISPLESPPCPPFSYTVSYASPFCNATLLAQSGPVPLVRLWWAAPWNGTPNVTTGAGFERASDHVNATPSSGSPIAVQDRDGNRNLTEGDVVQVWSPGGCGGDLLLFMGADATGLSLGQELRMEAGYQWTCGGSAPDYATALSIGAVVAAAVAIPLAILLLLWRRLPRR